MSTSNPSSSSGDRRGRFEAVATPLLGVLGAVARQLARPRDAADDLVQETILRAYRTFDGFTPGTSAKAWLLTILYSVASNSERRRRRAGLEISIDSGAGAEAASLEIADPEAFLSILRNPRLTWDGSEAAKALASLPEEFRLAVILVDLHDLGYEEAAAVMGCPINTMRSRLFRGRRRLAEALSDVAARLGYLGR